MYAHSEHCITRCCSNGVSFAPNYTPPSKYLGIFSRSNYFAFPHVFWHSFSDSQISYFNWVNCYLLFGCGIVCPESSAISSLGRLTPRSSQNEFLPFIFTEFSYNVIAMLVHLDARHRYVVLHSMLFICKAKLYDYHFPCYYLVNAIALRKLICKYLS